MDEFSWAGRRGGADVANGAEPEGASGAAGTAFPPELWVSGSGELWGVDPRILAEFGHAAESCPARLEDLIPPEHLAADAIREALSRPGVVVPGDRGEVSWCASEVPSPRGPLWRVRRVAGAPGQPPRDPIQVWTDGLAHQLRNQQMVLTNSIFTLGDATGGPLDDAAQRACLQLARGGIERSLALLESFTHLSDPASEPRDPRVGELVRWFETLCGARVRRRECTLSVDPGACGEIPVEATMASARLAATLECVLPVLGRGSGLTLGAREHGHSVSLVLNFSGVEPTAVEQVRAELLRWGVEGAGQGNEITVALRRASGGGA